MTLPLAARSSSIAAPGGSELTSRLPCAPGDKTSSSLHALNDDRAPELKGISGITPVGEVTRGTSGFSLQTAVTVFPPDQFEQVLYVLNDMTPQEARGIAVLTLCRNFLSHKEVRSKI